jgi:SpoIID/LytB domain protein
MMRRRALIALLLFLAVASGQVTAGGSAAQLVPSVSAGTVRIGVLRGTTYDVLTVPIDEYVGRVLAGEAAPETPPAALEALAVAVRTYTANNMGRHSAEGFDLCDQTHCQVMRDAATPDADRASRATADQILLYRGTPAVVYYSASCGGRSEKPSNVWPDAADLPYLTIHDDDGCGGFPPWASEVFDTDLQRALRAGGFTGTLRDVRVRSRNDSGRVDRLELVGLQPAEITGQDLRMVVGRTLGFQYIRSTMFDLTRTSRSTHFSGRGSGHGVGLCVIGSMKLAAAGRSVADILGRYYPGTELGRMSALPSPIVPTTTSAPSPIVEPPLLLPRDDARPAPPVTERPVAPPSPPAVVPTNPTGNNAPSTVTDLVVVLPASDAGERAGLATIAARERESVAKALGVPPVRARLRFHESTDQFEKATGRPSFELGAISGDEVQLAPLWLLRERGMLERTLRRQFVHLMADDVLPARPAWIRAGAAVYFADPEAASASRSTCPADDELLRPVSIGALGDALARARACFERQLGPGRDWRRVR